MQVHHGALFTIKIMAVFEEKKMYIMKRISHYLQARFLFFSPSNPIFLSKKILQKNYYLSMIILMTKR